MSKWNPFSSLSETVEMTYRFTPSPTAESPGEKHIPFSCQNVLLLIKLHLNMLMYIHTPLSLHLRGDAQFTLGFL